MSIPLVGKPTARRVLKVAVIMAVKREEGRRDDPPTLPQVKFLTVAEVATLMRVSKMTVYRLVHGGDLPAVRVGKSFRVPEKAVHEYLQNAYFDAG